MNSRDKILSKLRKATPPFAGVQPPDPLPRMVNLKDTSTSGLRARFIGEAEKLHCSVYAVDDDEAAIEQILALLGDDKAALAWDFEHIPVKGLSEALSAQGIQVASADDSTVKVGITGVASALAATGSLIVQSGPGKPRSASLLPDRHIAIVRDAQLIPDLDTWFEQQRAAGLERFRAAGNTVVISGPSKTADIAQELILGAHGPIEVHILLIAD